MTARNTSKTLTVFTTAKTKQTGAVCLARGLYLQTCASQNGCHLKMVHRAETSYMYISTHTVHLALLSVISSVRQASGTRRDMQV